MKSRAKVGNKKGSPAFRTPSWHRGEQSLLNKNYGPNKDQSNLDKFRRHRAR